MDVSELSRLEQYVDKLLIKYNELKKKCKMLEANLEEREDKYQGLEQKISALKDERSEVGSRVSGLISRIERWEADEGERIAGQVEKTTGVQGNLFASEGGVVLK